jgi:hypothetical protein
MAHDGWRLSPRGTARESIAFVWSTAVEEFMANDRSKRGPQDRSRISLSEDYEVCYWSEKFGVSKERLAEAVKKVGNSAAAVEKKLKAA